MAGLILQVFLDSVMALLLIITAVYCYRLNGRIKILQDSKSELARIIKEFDTSTQRATQSIAEIHEATARIAENMQHKIDKANYIADDLQFMIERGNKLAGRDDGPLERPSASRSKSRVESFSRGAEPKMTPANDAAGGSSRAAVDSMLRRVRGGGSEASVADDAEDAGSSRARRQGARLRSKAEQELFEALKSGGGKG